MYPQETYRKLLHYLIERWGWKNVPDRIEVLIVGNFNEARWEQIWNAFRAIAARDRAESA